MSVLRRRQSRSHYALEINRQPTSIYFEKDRIYFGSDSNPHGIFALDRRTDEIEQVFVMSDVLRSWFLAIVEARGSYWALSRSFGKDNFGVLWWSGDSKSWTPVQFFSHVPFWLQTDEQHNLISVGFGEERNYRLVKDGPVRVMTVPDRDTMAVRVRHGPTITLLDRIFRRRIMPQ
jgi:hypothetical protein